MQPIKFIIRPRTEASLIHTLDTLRVGAGFKAYCLDQYYIQGTCPLKAMLDPVRDHIILTCPAPSSRQLVLSVSPTKVIPHIKKLIKAGWTVTA